MDFGDNMESNVDLHIQDEAERLLKEIELVRKNVENSEFYAGMRLDLEGNETIRKHFSRLLDSQSQFQVVIYGLGSTEYSFHSQFQLAVALLLKQDFSNWIGNIEIYDPCMSPADIIVFKKLGLEVLTIDENCRRRARRPTIFYMPNPNLNLIGNVLGANWSSSCLNQISLLTNSFHNTLDEMPLTLQVVETAARLRKVLDFTTEIDIKTGDTQMYANVFSPMIAWHFFDVDPEIDIDTLGWYWLDIQRHFEDKFFGDMEKNYTGKDFAEILGNHRGPRRLRCKKVPPPPGWVKLNICGIGRKGDQSGRYSGIFTDEEGKFIRSYRGDIDVEDSVIAGLEALRLGLDKCLERRPHEQKLIVESDNVILVQYVNGRPEPNHSTMHMLAHIFYSMEHITCAVHYIYEEANKAARDLALRGECPNSE